MAATKPRRELYVNTVVSWLWTQGTLLASVLALPLLTRWLSKPEFGLWTQVLALSALANFADLGMSSVFVRRLAAPDSASTSLVAAVTRFYLASGAVLTPVLLIVCLIPGGIVTPFLETTHNPRLTAVVVIGAIIVNFLVLPYSIRLLSRGRLDLQNLFGAAPAVVGTLGTVVAAYLFRSALAVAVAYATVEVAFDLILIVLVTVSNAFTALSRADGRSSLSLSWKQMARESWAIFLIVITPQVMILIDSTIVGRVVGPAAVAIYAVAARFGTLVTRLFWPFSDSLFVSLCRTTGSQRTAVERHVVMLSWMVITSGLAIGCVVAAAGGHALTLIFGAGYSRAEGAVIALVAAATVRSMYIPTVRRIQVHDALPPIAKWFLFGLAAHIGLSILLTSAWSSFGAAFAVLATVVVFEAWPVARSAHHVGAAHKLRTFSAFTPLAAASGGSALLLALTWCRANFRGWPLVAAIALALVLGTFSVKRLVVYLRSSRQIVMPA